MTQLIERQGCLKEERSSQIFQKIISPRILTLLLISTTPTYQVEVCAGSKICLESSDHPNNYQINAMGISVLVFN